MTTTETTIVNGPAPKLPPHRPKTVTVPVKPCIELAHRLGLTDVQACEAVGIGRSLWYQAKRTGQISKTVALAFEALTRRQSRDATQWALLKLNHGTAEVTYIEEPQRLRLGGRDGLIIEENVG